MEIDAIVLVLKVFKTLMVPMLAEKTPTLGFAVPRFNILIKDLEEIINKASPMYMVLPQTDLQKKLRKWKERAAVAALTKIRGYYSKSLKVPAYAIATSKYISLSTLQRCVLP